nr:MAG TPA: hypothetical protein [Caudoviricetes sp.]
MRNWGSAFVPEHTDVYGGHVGSYNNPCLSDRMQRESSRTPALKNECA